MKSRMNERFEVDLRVEYIHQRGKESVVPEVGKGDGRSYRYAIRKVRNLIVGEGIIE